LRIQLDALAASIGGLGELDVERGFAPALQRVVDAAKKLFGAGGAGLMLVDADGVLRWASASDQAAQTVEDSQERLAQGPCLEAFEQHRVAYLRDVHAEPRWRELAQVMAAERMVAALSVPVELDGGLIGTLDVYFDIPWEWDPSEVSALRAYAAVVASLLQHAMVAHVKGRLADQLQVALDHRSLIEQAKGVLMEREGLDQTAAFERLRRTARSQRRRIVELAREVVDKTQLPS